MPTTIGIVQARMGSTRFPGKSLARLWGLLSLLEIVLTRVARARSLDLLILATTDQPVDDALVAIAESLTIPVFRGAEQDVLRRFCDAVEVFPADAVLRVCADNPLVDPVEIDRLVDFFWRNQPADYVCNDRLDCGLPDGVGAEIGSAECLNRLDGVVPLPMREHVFQYVTQNLGDFSIGRLEATGPLNRPEIRLDIDHPEDGEFISGLMELMDSNKGPYWSTLDVIQAVDLNPGLLELRRDMAGAESVGLTHG